MAELFERVSNWGRWGDDDERGALNLLTADRVARAGALVTGGRVVSCGRDLPTTPSADNPIPVQHMMLAAGDCLDNDAMPGFEQTTDFLGVACHGMGVTPHRRPLPHVRRGPDVQRRARQRRPQRPARGATRRWRSADGIVGRGVLLDIARLRGRRLPRARPARSRPAELEAAEAAAGRHRRLRRHPDRRHRARRRARPTAAC